MLTTSTTTYITHFGEVLKFFPVPAVSSCSPKSPHNQCNDIITQQHSLFAITSTQLLKGFSDSDWAGLPFLGAVAKSGLKVRSHYFLCPILLLLVFINRDMYNQSGFGVMHCINYLVLYDNTPKNPKGKKLFQTFSRKPRDRYVLTVIILCTFGCVINYYGSHRLRYGAAKESLFVVVLVRPRRFIFSTI